MQWMYQVLSQLIIWKKTGEDSDANLKDVHTSIYASQLGLL